MKLLRGRSVRWVTCECAYLFQECRPPTTSLNVPDPSAVAGKKSVSAPNVMAEAPHLPGSIARTSVRQARRDGCHHPSDAPMPAYSERRQAIPGTGVTSIDFVDLLVERP